MQTLWLPAPVLVLVRRFVNVVSSLSLTHHYYLRHTRSQLGTSDASGDKVEESSFKLWEAFKYLEWPAWIDARPKLMSLSVSARSGKDVEPTEQLSPQPDISDVDREPYLDDLRQAQSAKDTLHQLLNSPVLYNPIRKPRYPIALCHGLYGFDVRGPSSFPILQKHYWSNVLSILRKKVGADVIVTSVPSTGSIAARAESLHRVLCEKTPGRGINFIAHSMGGLDCRQLISHIRPTEYTPLSLTTIGTPHRGSPFMDWCKENIGIGRLRHKDHTPSTAYALSDPVSQALHDSHGRTGKNGEKPPSNKSTLSFTSLPSSFTMLLLSLLDSPAYANLTSTYLNHVFNPSTPDLPSVKYFSVAGRVANLSVWHPLWLPKMVLDGFEEKEREQFRKDSDPRCEDDDQWGNDALVTVQSARWGEFLGIMEGCDHWDLRGARGIEVDLPSVSVSMPGLNISLGGKAKDEGQKKDDGDGWNLTDWGKFVRAWKKEEKRAAKSAGAGISEQQLGERIAAMDHGAEKEHADEVVKSSTDKLSAVFDWIVDQVPSPNSLKPLSASAGRGNVAIERIKPERERSRKQAERNELETKMDLERFYIALCRKLYDEGL